MRACAFVRGRFACTHTCEESVCNIQRKMDGRNKSHSKHSPTAHLSHTEKPRTPNHTRTYTTSAAHTNTKKTHTHTYTHTHTHTHTHTNRTQPTHTTRTQPTHTTHTHNQHIHTYTTNVTRKYQHFFETLGGGVQIFECNTENDPVRVCVCVCMRACACVSVCCVEE